MSGKNMVRKHKDFIMAKSIWNGFEGKLIAIFIKELDIEINNPLQEFVKEQINLSEICRILSIKMINTTQIIKI
jgi:hypothetical protein